MKYSNYFIQPVNGKYSLFDFLINVLIENIQVISCSNYVHNSYSFSHRELSLKTNRYEEVNLSPLNKSHLYSSLSSKYNILDEKSFHFEFSLNFPFLPSGFHDPFLEEAFTEMKAEDYMGVDLDTYIRGLGRYFFASHTINNGYSLMSNYLRTISISKKNEFNVAYLGYPGEEIFKDYDNLIHSLTLLHPNYDTSDEEKYNVFKKRYLDDSNPNLLNYPFLIEGDDYIFMNELLLREKSSHRA